MTSRVPAMFNALGGLVALYTACTALRGEVYAKSGAWGRTVSRNGSPNYFWVVVGVYAVLSLALLTISSWTARAF